MRYLRENEEAILAGATDPSVLWLQGLSKDYPTIIMHPRSTRCFHVHAVSGSQVCVCGEKVKKAEKEAWLHKCVYILYVSVGMEIRPNKAECQPIQSKNITHHQNSESKISTS